MDPRRLQDLNLISLSKYSEMTGYPFFYTTPNESQIYHIICEEISHSSQLLTKNNVSFHNYPSIYVFYYQLSNDKCYQITCEMVSHSLIVRYLNKHVFGIELKNNCDHQQREYLEFSNGQKENLEFHLNQFLFNYLTPKQINKEPSNFSMIEQDVNPANIIIPRPQKKLLHKLCKL